MAADNKSLGRFILDGIPPAPRGVPQVEVTFDLDANGILQVKAKDKTSGKEQSIRIEASSGLTDEDIKRMQNEAEANAEADKKKMEVAEAKNLADQMIHTAEKALKDAEGKISEEIKNEVTQKRIDLTSIKNNESSSVEAIKNATEELSEAMMKIGEAMKTANDQAAQNEPTDATHNEAEENNNETQTN